jgi:ElaB/YqjD/DUF883 family membrane-anchored ribosome-binding protein
MDQPDVKQLITDLQTAVQQDPEAARQKVAELKSRVAGLPPEQKDEVAQLVDDLKTRAQALPSDQQQQLADIVSTIRGGSSTST